MYARRITSCALHLEERPVLEAPVARWLARAILLTLATLGASCANGHGNSANEEGSDLQRAELRRLGFLDTGPLLLATEAVEFHSDVRPGFAAVTVPSDVEFDVEDSWTIFPGMDNVYGFQFLRTVGDRQFHVRLDLRTKNDADQTFRWRTGAPHPEIGDQLDPSPGGSVLLITVYSGAPFAYGAPQTYARDAGWHKAAVDAHGHLWVHSDPEQAVAVDTGEAIDTSVMREIQWSRVRVPYPDLETFCGTQPYCYLMSKGGMYLPFPAADEIGCTSHTDGRTVTLTAAAGDLTFEFDVGLGRDALGRVLTDCADVLQLRSFEGELPAAFAARARETSTGRLLDIVVSAQGRLYVGDSTGHLRCPPCKEGHPFGEQS